MPNGSRRSCRTALRISSIVSALRFRRTPQLRNRYIGNILIAVGALLPGIGGAATRAGFVEVLYVTELIGLLLIYWGYRKNISGTEQTTGHVPVTPSSQEV